VSAQPPPPPGGHSPPPGPAAAEGPIVGSPPSPSVPGGGSPPAPVLRVEGAPEQPEALRAWLHAGRLDEATSAWFDDTDPDALIRSLLPRFYAAADVRGGGTLEALLGVLASVYGELRDGISRLYDDLFLETCREDLVPYVAAGLNINGVTLGPGPFRMPRSWVGHAVEYRRSKGTLVTLTRACAAATGWGARAKAGVDACARTPNVRAGQPGHARFTIADPRTAAAVPMTVGISGDPVGGGAPTDRAESDAGGFPAPSGVEISLWRAGSYPVTMRRPAPAAETGGRGFRFHPLGIDIPLFRRALGGRWESLGSSEFPAPVTRGELAAALAVSGGHPKRTMPVGIWAGGSIEELALVATADLAAADLSRWQPPAASTARVAVDPQLGRLLFLEEPPPTVRVDYAYGAAGSIGGGPYPAARRVDASGRHWFQRLTERDGGPGGLTRALGGWSRSRPDLAEIRIDDCATYTPNAGSWLVRLPAHRSLSIRANAEAAPVLDGRLRIHLSGGARMSLSGLLIAGGLEVSGSGVLSLGDTTLAPGPAPSITAQASGRLAVTLRSCISGPVVTTGPVHLSVSESILDGMGGGAVGQPDAPVDTLYAHRTTILGATVARVAVGENTLFTTGLTLGEPASGLARYCFVPPGSTPPAETVQCQPATEAAEAADPGLAGWAAQRVRPLFTSTRYGQPGYGQLHPACAHEIKAGGDEGQEMGAFGGLRVTSRVSMLSLALDEFLPAGCAASIRYRS
jgi:hypothetical protein